MKRPGLEVADVFKQYGEAYRASHLVSPEQHKVMAAITACRTARLGGHVEACSGCGATRNCYNSCRNRHCPKCQTMAKEKWLMARKSELLPCSYFHLVFTLPHCLNNLVLANRKELLALLFAAINGTLKAFAADPAWRLEGKPGFLVVLHTWSQTLVDHFHLHCLVPAGVLSPDGRQWIKAREKYLFGTTPLAKVFRAKYLEGVQGLLQSGKLVIPDGDEPAKSIAIAWGKEWIAYAKKPFAGPAQVLEYLGRYTHRVAISNYRLKSMGGSRVKFSYRDRADDNKEKIMELDAGEFIRRFLLHVLPDRFMKIRYFGFLANNIRRKSILLIRRLLGKEMPFSAPLQESVVEMMQRLTGVDITLCPICQRGKMLSVEIIPAADT